MSLALHESSSQPCSESRIWGVPINKGPDMVSRTENASVTLKGLAHFCLSQRRHHLVGNGSALTILVSASATKERRRKPPSCTSSDSKPSCGSTPEQHETSPPALSSSKYGEGRSTGNRSCPPEPCCGHVSRPHADSPATEGTSRASRIRFSLCGKLTRMLKCRY